MSHFLNKAESIINKDDQNSKFPSDNTPASINSDIPSDKKSGFGFLKKTKKNQNELSTQLENDVNTNINISSNICDEFNANNIPEKAMNTNFNFIKSKLIKDKDNLLNNANNETKSNNNNQLFTLESLLNSENLFENTTNINSKAHLNEIKNKSTHNDDVSHSNNTSNIDNGTRIQIKNSENYSNILGFEPGSPIKNELNINSINHIKLNMSNQEPVINIKQSNTQQKKAFNFVKSKKEEKQQLSTSQIENSNPENINDSDSKSLKSRGGFASNIKLDNISVILDNNEDDNKSLRSNNTSSITSSLKENLYLPPSKVSTGIISEIKKPPQSTSLVISTSVNLNPDPVASKKRCYDEIKKSEESVKDLVLKIHTQKKKLNHKQNDLTDLNSKLNILYEKENIAIENNDFDEAQLIENKISDIKENISRIKINLESNESELIRFRDQELLIIRNKWKIIGDTLNSLSKLKSIQEVELETFQNTDLNRHKNDNIKIKKLKEKLDFLKTNLDSDKSYIDEEEEKINKVIKSQSSGVFEEMEELDKCRNDIMNEIENLKKLLDKKYAELDIVDKAIESKEIEIDAIKSNFNHEFNKINHKKKNYEESFKDYEDQKNQYENMLRLYKSDATKYEEKIKNMQQDILDIENEIDGFKKVNISLQEELSKKEFLLKNENEILSKIHLIDMKYFQINKNIEKNLEEIQSLELSNKRLESEIVTMDMRIPSLEEEKKAFVNLKNFKEAGRVSNELKNLLENKNKNSVKINTNKNTIQELHIENEKINLDLVDIKDSKSKEDVDLNITKFDYLITYKIQLENLMRNYHTQDIENEYEFVCAEMAELEKFSYIINKFSEYLKPPEYALTKIEDNNFIDSCAEIQNENSQQNIQVEQEIHNDLDYEEKEGLNQQEMTEKKPDIDKEIIIYKINELNVILQKCIEDEDYDKAHEIQIQIDDLSQIISD